MTAELDGTDAQARADASVQGDALEQDRPLSEEEKARALSMTASGDLAEGPALLGARHDVKLTSTAGAVACRCVSALLGPPTMTQVEWQGAPPRTSPETQLFIALAPETDCAGAPAGTQGSSYWGYRLSGNDVVVVLEGWRPEPRKPGKPVPPRTIAAIIPKPPSGGQVYVAPLTRALPFGTALNDKSARCALGNPGAQRNTPLSPEEQGAAAPSSDETETVAD
jgi:hypothetical protein